MQRQERPRLIIENQIQFNSSLAALKNREEDKGGQNFKKQIADKADKTFIPRSREDHFPVEKKYIPRESTEWLQDAARVRVNEFEILAQNIQDAMGNGETRILSYYTVEVTKNGICIRENPKCPPNLDAQMKFRKLRIEKLAHCYAVFQLETSVNDNTVLIPSWDFFLPLSQSTGFTIDEILKLFNPEGHFFVDQKCSLNFQNYIKQKHTCTQLEQKTEESSSNLFISFAAGLASFFDILDIKGDRARLQPEEKSVDSNSHLRTHCVTVPVSFSDSPDIVLDLYTDVLSVCPERDGTIVNPYTMKAWYLKDLQLRQDIVDILDARIEAEQQPQNFVFNLIKLQKLKYQEERKQIISDRFFLADSVKNKLASLEEGQYNKIVEVIADLMFELEHSNFASTTALNTPGLHPDKKEALKNEGIKSLAPLIIFHIGSGRAAEKQLSAIGISSFFQLFKEKYSLMEQADHIVDCCDNLDNFIRWLDINQHHLVQDHEIKEQHYPNLLKTLKERQAKDEFHARYGIRPIQVTFKGRSILFQFKEGDYFALLQEYQNKKQGFPFNAAANARTSTWDFKLTDDEYQSLVKTNKQNMGIILDKLKAYRATMTASASSTFKKKVLAQEMLKEKEKKIDELIPMLEDNRVKGGLKTTNAVKLIAFREAFTDAAKTLSARRDEWLWWFMKAIATTLTAGIPYFSQCCTIWEVNGGTLVNETNETLHPTEQPSPRSH